MDPLTKNLVRKLKLEIAELNSDLADTEKLIKEATQRIKDKIEHKEQAIIFLARD